MPDQRENVALALRLYQQDDADSRAKLDHVLRELNVAEREEYYRCLREILTRRRAMFNPDQEWAYLEPADPAADNWDPQVIVMTEAQILEEFYPYWEDLMKKAGKDNLISEAACIEDWIVVHWAIKVRPRPEQPGPNVAERET